MHRLSVVLLLLSCASFAYSQSIEHDYAVVELNSLPKRIAALNWTAAEMLLTLGVKPVGVTTKKGYRFWQSNHPELPENVAEIGNRSEPNLKAIAQLKPDLIVGYTWRHARLYSQLSEIAPTVLYRQYGDSNDSEFRYFKTMQTNFLSLGRILGRQSEAEQHLSTMWATIKEAEERITDAGLSGEKAIVGKVIGMGLGVRVFNHRALAGSILQEIGLVNGWRKSIPGRDFSHLQLRQLSELDKNTHVFFIGSLAEKAKRLTQSPIWGQLDFVKSEYVYETPQLWSFGGPVSAARMAEILSTLITKKNPLTENSLTTNKKSATKSKLSIKGGLSTKGRLNIKGGLSTKNSQLLENKWAAKEPQS